MNWELTFKIGSIVFWSVAGLFFLKDFLLMPFTMKGAKTTKEYFEILGIGIFIIGSICIFAYAPADYVFYYVFFLITAYLLWLFMR